MRCLQLLKICGEDKYACAMYVIGWRDAYVAATFGRYGPKRFEHNPNLSICIPDGVVKETLDKFKSAA